MTIDGQTAVSTAKGAAARREHPGRPAKRVPGEIGIWVFIYGDLAVFGLLFCMYVIYRRRQPDVFDRSQQTMLHDLGFANTVILLVSSVFVVIGMRAIKAGARRAASRALMAAMACGAAFVVLKAVEWHAEAAQGNTPYTNDFYHLYYVLTGLHLVHVLVGLCVLVHLFRTAQLPVAGNTRLAAAESGACFWHMVDLLWVVIFPLIYLLR